MEPIESRNRQVLFIIDSQFLAGFQLDDKTTTTDLLHYNRRFLSATIAKQMSNVFGKLRKIQKENCGHQMSLNKRNTSKQHVNAGQMDDLW